MKPTYAWFQTDSLSAAQLAELAGIYVEAIKSGLGDNAR